MSISQAPIGPDDALALRYARPVPRYTSYPTVPYWTKTPLPRGRWLDLVRAGAEGGVSLYVHLPFCERLCTYCGCNKRITRRHEVEAPYVDALLAEWAIYRTALPAEPVIKQLHLGGGTPTFFSPGQLARLLAGLLEGAAVPRRRDYSVEVHPATTTREQLATLAEFGFNRLSIGVQDVDPRVLGLINRPQDARQVADCVRWGRELGYRSINFDLVYGLPGQGAEQIAANVELVRQLRPDRIAHYGYAHVPWRSPGQRGYDEADLAGPIERWALRESAADSFAELGYETIGFDHYALPGDPLARAKRNGRLSRNFMGYTTLRHTALLGLGCSAISEVGGAFAQNLKGVEEYAAAVGRGELAHFNGHTPSGRDQQVSRLIKELLCSGSTSLPAFDLGYTLPVLERLREPLREGLVTLNGLTVRLTEAGRALSRHVALALDERYWRRRPTVPTFSGGV